MTVALQNHAMEERTVAQLSFYVMKEKVIVMMMMNASQASNVVAIIVLLHMELFRGQIAVHLEIN